MAFNVQTEAPPLSEDATGALRVGNSLSTSASDLFQLPDALLQELPLWFLLGQRQSFLIRGLSLRNPP